jgi:hypothetical protein
MALFRADRRTPRTGDTDRASAANGGCVRAFRVGALRSERHAHPDQPLVDHAAKVSGELNPDIVFAFSAARHKRTGTGISY